MHELGLQRGAPWLIDGKATCDHPLLAHNHDAAHVHTAQQGRNGLCLSAFSETMSGSPAGQMCSKTVLGLCLLMVTRCRFCQCCRADGGQSRL